jgi:6-phosphogluconolactonase (cycloisomerase 2 family)
MFSSPRARHSVLHLSPTGCVGEHAYYIGPRPICFLLVFVLIVFLASCTTTGSGGGVQSSTPNPQPSISTVFPSSALVGSTSQTLAINGSNFLASSTVTFAGTSHTATFVNSQQLTIQLTAADEATAGNYPVVVANPAPGGGQSNSVNFTVNNPQPTLSSVSPAAVGAGAPDTTIVVTGSNFVATSKVNLNGAALTTSFVSPTQLTATVPSAALTAAGTGQIIVTNPPPGGGTSSSSGTFLVNPNPTGPSMVPPILVSGSQTQLTVTAYVLGADTATHVQLFSLVGGGQTLVGNMVDDGTNGDQRSGDHVYTITTKFTAPVSSPVSLRVVASESAQSSAAIDFSVQVARIPSFASNADLNQAEAQLYITAVQTRSLLSSTNLNQQTLLHDVGTNLVGMFGEFEGITAQDVGITDLWAPASNVVSCDQLIESLAGFRADPANTLPLLSLDDPRLIQFAQELATLNTDGFTASDFLGGSFATAAAVWAREYMISGQPLPTPISGCSGGVAHSLANVAVKQELEQFTDLASEGISALADFGFFSTKLLGTAADTLVGWFVDNSGNQGVTIGQVGPNETFGAPTGTYNLWLSSGGDTANTKITNTPIYPNSTTLINENPGTSVTVTPPLVSGFNPPSGQVGTAVNILGTGFSPAPDGNKVLFNGTAAPVSSSTSSSIIASVPDGATSGPVSVATSNGSSTSAARFTVTVIITNPVPAISSLSPSSLSIGAPSQTLVINGSSFITSSSVTFNGVLHTTTFVSSTQLTILLGPSDLATAGNFPVVVTNPSPGGGNSNVLNFAVSMLTGPHILTVASTNPVSGVTIAVSPPDNNIQSNGATQFTRTYNDSVVVTLSAPASAGGNNFSSWTGCDSVSGTACTVTMNADRTVIANYVLPGTTLTVASTNPSSGVPITVSPLDNSSRGDGTTQFARTYNNGVVVSLGSPPTASGNNFSGWTGCDSTSGTACTITMNTDHTVIANYVPTSPDKFAYQVNEVCSNFSFIGCTSIYTIDSTTGVLTSAGSPPSAGSDSLAIAVDPLGKFAYVVNVQSGDVSMYTIDPTTGTLAPISACPGCVNTVSAGSFPSFIAVHPSGKFAYVLNADGISVYTVNSTTGILTPTLAGILVGNANSIAVHPAGNFAYDADPVFHNVNTFAVNSTTGALTIIDQISNIYASAVVVHPSGKFAYVVDHSTANQVYVFAIDAVTGKLTLTGTASTRVSPSSITIDPLGKFAYELYAPSGNPGQNVTAYTINSATGALTEVGTFAPVPGLGLDSLTVDRSGKFAYTVEEPDFSCFSLTSTSLVSISAYTIDSSTGFLTPHGKLCTDFGGKVVVTTGPIP